MCKVEGVVLLSPVCLDVGKGAHGVIRIYSRHSEKLARLFRIMLKATITPKAHMESCQTSGINMALGLLLSVS